MVRIRFPPAGSPLRTRFGQRRFVDEIAAAETRHIDALLRPGGNPSGVCLTRATPRTRSQNSDCVTLCTGVWPVRSSSSAGGGLAGWWLRRRGWENSPGSRGASATITYGGRWPGGLAACLCCRRQGNGRSLFVPARAATRAVLDSDQHTDQVVAAATASCIDRARNNH